MTISRRTLILVLAGVVAVAAIVAGVVISTGGGGKSAAPATTASPTGQATKRPAFLVGVPQHGITLGNPDAPALEEYADAQCPYCADAANVLVPDVVREYVRTGRVKLVWHGLAFLGPDSVTALKAIDAAAPQNRVWDVAERIYARQGAENSGWVTQDLLDEVGQSVGGLDVQQWKADWDSKQTQTLMTQAQQAAVNAGVRGTPTFVFAGQQLQLTSLDIDGFRQAIEPLLD